MRRLCNWIYGIVVAASIICLVAVSAAEDEDKKFEGTGKTELAGLVLPQPSTVKVAVIPFWDYKSSERHIRISDECCRELLDRHGFILLPQDVIVKAMKADKEVEPGQPLRRSDAIRIGKAVSADWVIYGEIYELRTYIKSSFLSARKKAQISLKVSIADVPSESLLYWHKRSDTSGGTAFANLKKAEKVERKACDVCLNRAFDVLLTALPKHPVKAEKPEVEDSSEPTESSETEQPK